MRVVTNEDVTKYFPMVNKYIRDTFCKNWTEASTKKGCDEISLGNTGVTISDLRQHLLAEVVVALQKYNPDYRTAEGRSVKEATFVFQHLMFRSGQTVKRLTKRRYGYGFWSVNIDEVLGDKREED